ncbi:MAG: sulfotransferase [Rudaea sp.]|uniref:tetratricopeptide repeat-containing sulfotransferase family protein n=1 Tax=Rudaea sp. TaxID=2136325 RepID=UPI0039E446F5
MAIELVASRRSSQIPGLIAAFERGCFEEVVSSARALLDGSSQDEPILSLLGAALMELKRPMDAALVYQDAVQRFPHMALHWSNLGTALRQEGRLTDAVAAYAEALRIEPVNAGYLVNMAFLCMQMDDIVEAEQLFWRAFESDPTNIDARIYGAGVCMDCGDDARAHAMLDDWRDWSGRLNARLAVELGSQLIRMGNSKDGELLLRRYANSPTCGTLARARLIVVLERINKVKEAREILWKLPRPEMVSDEEICGEIVDAHVALAVRNGELSLARKLLEGRLSKVPIERWRTSALFLLAKICDEQRDYVTSINYLNLAHFSQVKILRRLVPELLTAGVNPLRICDTYLTYQPSDRWTSVAKPSSSESPVFVVGFPKSGTTMLEQMLDAHPDLRSMDERSFLHQAIEKMADFGLSYPGDLDALTPDQIVDLRNAYWRSIAEVIDLREGQRLVDKNPLNMLRLPMIVRLFPHAPIIFVLRHPCDVILSCYMQQFRSPGFSGVCSTLESLSLGYAAAMNFWIHHTNLLGKNLLEWRYEDVVRNFDANVVRLAKFLNLEDSEPLRHFNRHATEKGYISTPSYSQVVKPLYGDSIERWKNYRNSFEKILPILEPALKYFGYHS